MTRPKCPYCKKPMPQMSNRAGQPLYSCRDYNCFGSRKNYSKSGTKV